MYPNNISSGDDIYAKSYELQQTFKKGEIVATPQGRGKIAEVKREKFNFPARRGEKQIDARINKPVYIVSFENRYGVYKASNLERSSFEEDGTANQGSGRSIATASKHDVEASSLDIQ